jgi:hypothetical protein
MSALRGNHDFHTAYALVEPFARADITRPHMSRPFYCEFAGRSWLAATDGHRAALVYCQDAADHARVPNAFPLDVVLDDLARSAHRGEWSADSLAPLRALPSRWVSHLEIGAECRYSASTQGGTGKRAKPAVSIFRRVKTDWAFRASGGYSSGIQPTYLIDVFDALFPELAAVQVWQADPLSPWFFTATNDPILDAGRIGLVMPVRV